MIIFEFIISMDKAKRTMKPKKRQKKLRITERDFLLANRRAARIEEIEAHGRPVSFRGALHKSKKVYNRKALKRQASDDDLPLSLTSVSPSARVTDDDFVQERIQISLELR